jgi:hypothetical protein
MAELVCAILTHRTGNRIRFGGLISAHIRGDAVVMTVQYRGRWGSVRARARARLGLVDSLPGSGINEKIIAFLSHILS